MPEVKCEWCGKILHRSQSAYEKSSTKRFFCNDEEKTLWGVKTGAFKEAQLGLKKTRGNGPALVWRGEIYG